MSTKALSGMQCQNTTKHQCKFGPQLQLWWRHVNLVTLHKLSLSISWRGKQVRGHTTSRNDIAQLLIIQGSIRASYQQCASSTLKSTTMAVKSAGARKCRVCHVLHMLLHIVLPNSRAIVGRSSFHLVDLAHIILLPNHKVGVSLCKLWRYQFWTARRDVRSAGGSQFQQ